MQQDERSLEVEPAPVETGGGEVGTFVDDLAAGRCVFCSEAFARLHGVAVAEAGARLTRAARLAEFVHAADRARHAEVVEAAVRERRPYRIAYRLTATTGRTVEVVEAGEVWAGEDGTRLVGSLEEAGARRRIEDELERARAAAAEAEASNARLLAAAESLMDGLAIYDADDRLIYYNSRYPEHAPPAFRDRIRLGARFSDLIRGAEGGGGMYHPSMGGDFVARRLEHHRQPREDQVFRIADGRWMRVRESATPGGGRVLLTRDITDRRLELEERGEREQLWRAIAEGVPLPVVIARIEEPEVLFANRRAKETFGLETGYQPDSIRAAYVRSEDRKTLVRRLEQDGRVDNLEVRLKRADGTTMWALLSALAMTFDGAPALLAAVTDISERKAAEEALRASEARFMSFFKHSPVGMYVKDAEGRYVLAHEYLSRACGRPVEEIVGRTAGDIFPAEFAETVAARHREVVESGRATAYEEYIPRLDGGSGWHMVIRFPIPNAAGQITNIGGFVVDIGERRAMEEALRDSEARYRAVVDSQTEFIIRQRPDGVLTFVNDAFCRFRGMTREEMLAGYNDLEALPAPARDEVLRQWAELSPERPRATYDIRIDLPDGGVRFEQWTDTAMYDAQGRLLEYQSVGREITEQKLAETALRESEARLQAFMEHAPVGMFVKELDDRLTLLSPGIGTVTGYPVEQMRGRRATEFLPPDAAARIAAADRELVETGRVVGYEERIERPDGDFWNLVIRFPIRDSAGRIAQIGGFRIDITERKRMEEALRESEARLSAFMTHAPVGMYVKDLEGRYVMLNPEMSKVLQADADYMLGRTVAESPAGHPAEVISGFDREVLRTGQVKITEEHSANVDIYEWEMVIRFPIRNAEGEITHIAGFDVDITPRKHMEEALRASERRFKAFAEAHPVPVVISQLEDQRILFVSPPFLELFRTTFEDLAKGDLARFYARPEERAATLERIRRDGAVQGLEVELRRSDGSVFWGAFNSRLIDYEGRAAVVSGVIDITERKRAEEELERQRETLIQSEKMSALGSLLASVAHELNNPLSVVVGQSAMLEELAGGTTMAERAGRIRAAAERCARIVKTFLAMARSKPPEHSEVQLNDAVRAALDIATYALRSTGVEVRLELAADLPRIWADGDQLYQVITNLIINAKQAMQSVPGPRRLSIRSWAEAERAEVRLEIADTGPGIDETMRQRIFDPFFTTKPQGVGTGIGLSVAQRIVKAHGGEIGVDNRPEGGAVFTLRLPVGQPSAAAGAAEETSAAAGAPAARVLVVDDEPDVGEVLAEILRLDGLVVDVVESGRSALERLAGESYDLVISDLRMPDVDGPALYRELARSHPELLARVMFITGDTLSPDASEFLATSGRPVIGKPFDPRRVRQVAAEQLEAGREAPAAG